jgi:hypothetical protein
VISVLERDKVDLCDAEEILGLLLRGGMLRDVVVFEVDKPDNEPVQFLREHDDAPKET